MESKREKELFLKSETRLKKEILVHQAGDWVKRFDLKEDKIALDKFHAIEKSRAWNFSVTSGLISLVGIYVYRRYKGRVIFSSFMHSFISPFLVGFIPGQLLAAFGHNARFLDFALSLGPQSPFSNHLYKRLSEIEPENPLLQKYYRNELVVESTEQFFHQKPKKSEKFSKSETKKETQKAEKTKKSGSEDNLPTESTPYNFATESKLMDDTHSFQTENNPDFSMDNLEAKKDSMGSDRPSHSPDEFLEEEGFDSYYGSNSKPKSHFPDMGFRNVRNLSENEKDKTDSNE
jgi:hypothetical protein